MGQLTIYLPDQVEKSVRRNAKRARKTVSAYIASLEKKSEPLDANGYPLDFAELFGSCPGLKLALRDDEPPEIPDLGPSLPDRHRRVRRRARRR